jgi:hypothetical protein
VTGSTSRYPGKARAKVVLVSARVGERCVRVLRIVEGPKQHRVRISKGRKKSLWWPIVTWRASRLRTTVGHGIAARP